MHARAQSWGKGSGTVGDELGSSSIMEAVSANGRDYVVWRLWWQRVSPIPHPTEVHQDSSAVEVDVVRGTLIPVSRSFPARSLRLVSDPLNQQEPFEVAGITGVAATEYRGQRFGIVLRRKRGEETLPDVVLCEPPFNSAAMAVSADRRHALGACQDSSTTPRYSYDLVVHSTVTGERVGHLIKDGRYPRWCGTAGWPITFPSASAWGTSSREECCVSGRSETCATAASTHRDHGCRGPSSLRVAGRLRAASFTRGSNSSDRCSAPFGSITGPAASPGCSRARTPRRVPGAASMTRPQRLECQRPMERGV